jgi:hypothetical protein
VRYGRDQRSVGCRPAGRRTARGGSDFEELSGRVEPRATRARMPRRSGVRARGRALAQRDAVRRGARRRAAAQRRAVDPFPCALVQKRLSPNF